VSDGVIWATAVYDYARRPGMLTVTQDSDRIERLVPVQMGAPEPRRIALAPTPWTAPPGSEWQQGETGSWSIRVYRRED
jgi:hypothetical protein